MEEFMNLEFGYYARQDEGLKEKDRNFDDQLRETVKSSGDRALMALYTQNQEILNLLRRIEERTRGMK